MRTVCILVLVMGWWLAAGCRPAEKARVEGEPITVVCTTGMVADIVRNVAGERAAVTNIIGTGIDPHLFKATRSDIIRLSQADVVFYSGLLLEGKMSEELDKIATPGKPVVPVANRLPKDYLLYPETAHGQPDPHVWMHVRGWMQAAEVVRDTLIAYDPPHADAYRANTAAYLEQLAELDTYVARVIGSIPEKQRFLVTAHDAFNYLGRAYGIEVLGIQGLSTESEAGLEDVNRLVDLLVRQQIGAIFVETSVAQKNVMALIEGARARGHRVSVGGWLFSDAMGDAGTYEGTYIGMIDHNATTIARALGGEAPAGGMQGKLKPEASQP